MGTYTTLTPRQPILPTPFAVRSWGSIASDSLSCTSCINNNHISVVAGSKIMGPIPVTSIPAGSDAYIQNSTSEQASANFNISGDGAIGGNLSIAGSATADTVNAQSFFELGGQSVLRVAGSNEPLGESLFVGRNAGTNSDPMVGLNTFVGSNAGADNMTGFRNAFVGSNAGRLNTSGQANSYLGDGAGVYNQTGSSNTMVGFVTGFANTANNNSFFGRGAGFNNNTGGDNAFFGMEAGVANTSGSQNVFVGITAGNQNTTGSLNTALGSRAGVASGNLSYATAIGAESVVSTSNTVVLGRSTDLVIAPGTMRVAHIPLQASTASVCFNVAGDLLQCGGSSLRLKDNVQTYFGGLDTIMRLRPIRFDWKESGMADIGLGAEEVLSVDPTLAFTNAKGEAEGVKYEKLGILLINAVKEQQVQIESLLKTNAELAERIKGLERIR
jgi:hypothetical protein